MAKDDLGKSTRTTTTIISTEMTFIDEDKHFITFVTKVKDIVQHDF